MVSYCAVLQGCPVALRLVATPDNSGGLCRAQVCICGGVANSFLLLSHIEGIKSFNASARKCARLKWKQLINEQLKEPTRFF